MNTEFKARQSSTKAEISAPVTTPVTLKHDSPNNFLSYIYVMIPRRMSDCTQCPKNVVLGGIRHFWHSLINFPYPSINFKGHYPLSNRGMLCCSSGQDMLIWSQMSHLLKGPLLINMVLRVSFHNISTSQSFLVWIFYHSDTQTKTQVWDTECTWHPAFHTDPSWHQYNVPNTHKPLTSNTELHWYRTSCR